MCIIILEKKRKQRKDETDLGFEFGPSSLNKACAQRKTAVFSRTDTAMRSTDASTPLATAASAKVSMPKARR